MGYFDHIKGRDLDLKYLTLSQRIEISFLVRLFLILGKKAAEFVDDMITALTRDCGIAWRFAFYA